MLLAIASKYPWILTHVISLGFTGKEGVWHAVCTEVWYFFPWNHFSRFACTSGLLDLLHLKGLQDIIYSVLLSPGRTGKTTLATRRLLASPFWKIPRWGIVPLQISLKILWRHSKKGLLHGFSLILTNSIICLNYFLFKLGSWI